ncbi:HdeD family acid-resistance protein [Actinomadura sp. HBU206391]|uniref:HdeD family acid-resistance protein n=1 Tax=Actinomadura sp. HBU206391 TaxID=2731692 RepID=UPI001650314C|nr:HdeD family acid-resistance protein [Actinomadura sp. HBU206391]MBC6457320.1 HdeD family acid-resistance protein [Actinomadura sp. HBU206391]
MLDNLARHWSALAVRGVLAVAFGLIALIWPGITLLVLAVVFGAYAFVDGVFAALAAVRAQGTGRIPLILGAIAGILIGVVTFFWPGATLFALTILIGAWVLITGIFQIFAAIRLRKELPGEWIHLLTGLVSVLFGVMVLFWPVSGAVAVAWLIGIYAIIFGILLITAGLRARKGGQRLAHGPTGGPAASPL